MTQDTRKDPRAKIVSLNVRYKSATVDEFIENHSHDVSKGGVFIKTDKPFAVGTLLKFEIRLAADQPVIAGVGRVVWKREAGTAGAERPAGMGVKFIKIDDNSRTTIDKLTGAKSDAGREYLSEAGASVTPPPPNASHPPAEASASVPPVNITRSVVPGTTPTKPGMGAPKAAFTVKKTMMGIGSPLTKTSPQAPISKQGERTEAESSGNFFPKTDSVADMPPPQERTVMKQAAELLEEALKEAGGSMEEVGAVEKKAAPVAAGVPAEAKASEPAPAPEPEAPAAAVASAVEQIEPKKPISEPPPRKIPSTPPKAAEPIAARKIASLPPPPEKKSNVGMIALGLVVAAGIAGGVAYKAGMFGPQPTPTPTASASAQPSAAQSAGVYASASASAAPTETATESAAASASAAPSASASAAPTATAMVTATATAQPTATAVVTHPTATATAQPTATATEAPTATATATATATTTAAATATATAKPPATAKTAKPPADDNPY